MRLDNATCGGCKEATGTKGDMRIVGFG
jgi:hypothetical protein